MPISNLNNSHFSEDEKNQINAAIDQLAQLLDGKMVNLSPEERQKYGSVNEQNKLFLNKVNDYRVNQPQLSSPDVNWDEFGFDRESREFLEAITSRIQAILTGVINAKILHDHDNYQDALTDYSYAQYKFGTSAKDYENKVNDLKQFFNRSTTSPNPDENPTSDDNT